MASHRRARGLFATRGGQPLHEPTSSSRRGTALSRQLSTAIAGGAARDAADRRDAPNLTPLDWETIDHTTYDANENGSIAPSAVADIHLTGSGDAELVIYSHDPFWNRLIDWAEGDARPITVVDVLDSKGALISASADDYFFVMPYKGSTLTMIFSGTSKAEVTRLVRSLKPASEDEWARVVGS